MHHQGSNYPQGSSGHNMGHGMNQNSGGYSHHQGGGGGGGGSGGGGGYGSGYTPPGSGLPAMPSSPMQNRRPPSGGQGGNSGSGNTPNSWGGPSGMGMGPGPGGNPYSGSQYGPDVAPPPSMHPSYSNSGNPGFPNSPPGPGIDRGQMPPPGHGPSYASHGHGPNMGMPPGSQSYQGDRGGSGRNNSNSGMMPSNRMNNDRMGSDRMGGDRMGGDRMGGDRMGGDRMGGDRMGGDRMGGDRTDRMNSDRMGNERIGSDRMGGNGGQPAPGYHQGGQGQGQGQGSMYQGMHSGSGSMYPPPPPHHGGSSRDYNQGMPISPLQPGQHRQHSGYGSGGSGSGGGGGTGSPVPQHVENFPAPGRAPPSHQPRQHAMPGGPPGGFAQPPHGHHSGGGSMGGPGSDPMMMGMGMPMMNSPSMGQGQGPMHGGPGPHGMGMPMIPPPLHSAGGSGNLRENGGMGMSMGMGGGMGGGQAQGRDRSQSQRGSGPTPGHQPPPMHVVPPSHPANLPPAPMSNSFSGPAASGLSEANPELRPFLESKNLLRSCTLQQLKEHSNAGRTSPSPSSSTRGSPSKSAFSEPIRMAFDGNHFLKEVLSSVCREDPLWLLAGPFPPTIKEQVAIAVHKIQQAGITPVFVFSGMAVHGDVESWVSTQDEMQGRDQIWSSVEANAEVTLADVERAFDLFLGEDVEMMIIRFMTEKLRVEAYRAPFLQWGQMVAYTLPKFGHYCTALRGPCELLLFDGVGRVYVELDPERDEAKYFDKAEVLKALFPAASESEASALFLDLALLTASHVSLILLRPPMDNATLPYMLQVLRRVSTSKEQKVTEIVNGSFPDKKQGFSHTWKFLKGRAFIRHCMVLVPGPGVDGLTPLSKLIDPSTLVPRNLTGVLGSRLPPLLYFFQFIGLLSVSTMTTVSQNYIRDDNPVSDSQQFRTCMETIISLRTQVLYQLVQFLQQNEEYFHRVKVSWIRWYEPISAPVRRPPEIRLAHWMIQEVPETGDYSDVNFQNVISFAAKGTNASEVHYTNLNQVLHAIHLKSLDLLGYFTHANVDEETDPGVEVSGMSCYSETIRFALQSPRFVEQCVLLIELLRTRSLSQTRFVCINAQNFNLPHYTLPSPELPVADAVVAIASRISSLVNIPLKEGHIWPGPYDRELMTFNVLARNMHRTLRTTTEVIACSMYLDGSATIPISAYAEIPKYLPFKTPPSTYAGLLIQHLLTSSPEGSPQERIAELEERFPALANVAEALRTLCDFWEDAYSVVTELNEKDPATVDDALYTVMTMVVTQIRSVRESTLGETPDPGNLQPTNEEDLLWAPEHFIPQEDMIDFPQN